MLQDSVISLGDSVTSLGLGFAALLPKIVLAVVLFVVGFVVAGILSKLVAELVRMLKVDKVLGNTGIKSALDRAGVSLNSGVFLGEMIRWFVILAFLVSSLEILGLSRVTYFLSQVLAYIPTFVSAGLIIVVTAVVAEFVKKIITSSAQAASFAGSAPAGKLVKATVWVFGVVMALQVIGVPTQLFNTVITGVVAALSLAFGLAFGLGGRDVAAQILAKTYQDIEKK